MYARKKGRSGSHRSPSKKKPDWVDYDKDEIAKLIDKLASEGHGSAKIGLMLRDQYGIPSARSFGIRISKSVSKKHQKPVPEEMYNLMVKVVGLHSHLEKNKKDTKNKHAMELMESKIRRFGKYYVKKGRLPKDWKYNIEQAKLLVK